MKASFIIFLSLIIAPSAFAMGNENGDVALLQATVSLVEKVDTYIPNEQIEITAGSISGVAYARGGGFGNAIEIDSAIFIVLPESCRAEAQKAAADTSRYNLSVSGVIESSDWSPVVAGTTPKVTLASDQLTTVTCNAVEKSK